MNPNKSQDPHGLHPRLLKKLAEELSHPLSILFSRSLQEGAVPAIWLEACITPIFKKGSKKQPSNYRPVGLTSIVCKLMKSIICYSIVDHLNE